MKPEKTTLAVNISKRRKQLGLTQPDLADKVGVHLNTIKDIERGLSRGHLATREAIAKVLGCEEWQLDVPGLFDESKPREESLVFHRDSPPTPDRASLILEIQDLLKTMGQDDLETLKTTAEGLIQLSQVGTKAKEK